MDDNGIHVQIHSALREGDITRAISFIDDYDVDYRDVTHDLQTILMKMCYIDIDLTSLQTVLEAMFNKCPDVNIQDSWGRTFLMHACIANKPSVIEALLGYESTDVTMIDFDGNSALSYAVQNCDVYTLEDLLNHGDGPRLLNHYNAKGQSPYTIATKSGDKHVLKLFDAHINKSIGLQDKRHRKHKHHDVIKLPPAYSTSPRDVVVTARDVLLSTRDPSTISSKSINCDLKFQERCDLRLKIPVSDMDNIRDSNVMVKCESAPTMRTQRDDYMTSLSLSSPRLARRHHKQDCLLTERVTLGKSLPPMAMKALMNSKSNLSNDNDIPDVSKLQRRRPSLSLPDLRDVTGSLVSSGNSSPVSDCEDHPLRRFDSQDDGIESEDDVFSRSFPNVKAQTYRRSSKHQLSLPEIVPGMTNMTSQSKTRIGISPLARQRQFSTSDDQLHRNLISQKN